MSAGKIKLNFIKVIIPEFFSSEIEYTISTLFTEIGQDVKYEIVNKDTSSLQFELDNDLKIVIVDYFFNNLKEDFSYKNKAFLPKNYFWLTDLPWKKLKHKIPVFFGKNELEVSREDDRTLIKCHIDVVSMVYFLLSRWEEIDRTTNMDGHERFNENELFMVKNNLHQMPVVEYLLEFLIELFSYNQRCSLSLKKSADPIILSCDVDHVRYFKGFNYTIKKLAGDFLKRKNFSTFFADLFLLAKFNIGKNDPANTFRLYHNFSEKGIRTEFNILVANEDYHDFPDRRKKEIIKEIIKDSSKYGVKLGFHPGYLTSDNNAKFRQQIEDFEAITGLEAKSYGGRYHFLRFSFPDSFHQLESKLSFDSSFGYSETFGFRCGTCHEFTLFDPLKRKKINLKERPIVLMDSFFLKLRNPQKAKYLLNHLQQLVSEVSGSLIFIWHNSSHDTPLWKKFKIPIKSFLKGLCAEK